MCSAAMERHDDRLGPVAATSWRRETEARGSGGVTAMADRLGDLRWRQARAATAGLGAMMDADDEVKGDRDGRGRSEVGSRPIVRGFAVEDLRRELGCGVRLKLEVRCEDGSDRGRLELYESGSLQIWKMLLKRGEAIWTESLSLRLYRASDGSFQGRK